VAPDRFKAWLGEHGGKAPVIALSVIGAVFIVPGVITIAT
jgi:hypothetical protein